MVEPVTNPHLLLLHGALGSLETLSPLAKALDRERLVFSLNFSGHGGTPIEHPFSIDLFTAEVLEVLDKVELAQVDIFGYSMGGYVALNLARHHPERVRRIYTLGTQFDWRPELAAAAIKRLVPAQIEAKVPAFAETLAQRHHPEDWREVVEATAQMMQAMGAAGGFSAAAITEITHPVMVAVGQKDTLVNTHVSRQVARLLAKGQFAELAGLPHPIEQVDQLALAAQVAEFLSDPTL
jgi:pimeloyl-ACP methyl ester carboxylesterase